MKKIHLLLLSSKKYSSTIIPHACIIIEFLLVIFIRSEEPVLVVSRVVNAVEIIQ